MAESIISISDSDDEDVVPSTSASASSTSRNNPSPSTKPPPSLEFSLLSSAMSSFNISTQSSYDSASGLAAMFKPLGADLLEARQLQAMKKKRMAILTPFPVVRDVVTKLRLLLGIHESKRNVLGIAQDYITSLKFYQRQIMNCPNRCRLLARHITMTMCLIRDLSRHLFDSPHYSQKISELLGLYIFFELHCATDFKDSKVKIAERIISNIHLHLQNAKANFVLRIFAFLDNMCKQGEIATKVFQRLIPEPIVMVKNELPDRLFIQYLIVFYHWKEAWNDYEDQQKVVAFANKFMKPMNTIKSNDIYSKHLPSYIKRDDAAGYFLSNLVFFNDLRTASILDGVLDNGIIDLCDDEKVYPILDLSQTIFEPVQPLVQNIKVEPREMDGTVDLTEDDDETWLNKLIRRAVALEVILPPRLLARNEDQAPAVIELSDSDNENEEENGNDDDWAFGPRNDQQPQLEEEQPQIEGEQQQPAAEPENPQVNQEDTDSLNDLFNELNSSLDFGDESTTESEKGRRKIQKERYEYAVKLTDAQVRLTFDGVVEKELRAMVVQGQAVAAEAVPVEAASDGPSTSTAAASARSVSEKTDPVSNTDDQPTISKTAPVSKNLISSKAAAATEKPASTEMVVESTKNTSSSSSMLTEPSEKSNSSKVPDAVVEEPEIISEPAASISHQDDENEEPSIFTSDIIEEVQSNPVRNDQEISTESAALVVEQPEAQSANVDPTTDHDQTLSTILQQIQSPRDAITYTMDTLLSSFDSSDESDEDFIGRFQKPPFKTYLRRAHKRLSKREKAIGNFSTGSSEENDATNVEAKKLSSLNENENNNKQQTLSPPILPLSSDTTTNTENPNVLFSGKVISLREDDGAGGVTPNYLNTPESVEVSKHGSNVVFSMQGRRLSSFPALKVTSNDNTMPDFDEEIAMTGGEDSNSRTDDITFRKKAFKKSSIANAKKAKSAQGADKHRSKAKSVWFAENPQVREIESRKSTPSPQKSTSAINVISSTVNKISANKQHFTSKILSTPSTSTTTQPTTLTAATTLINKTKSNFFDTNKFTKSNHLIQNRSNPITTESSAITAALKSAQEKGMQNFDSLSKNNNISSITNDNLSVFNDNINIIKKINEKHLPNNSSSRENISLPHPNLNNIKTISIENDNENDFEKQCTPHFINNIILEMEKENASSTCCEDTNFPSYPLNSPLPVSEFDKQIVTTTLPDNDNRTDDVLAAAEILANGIGFPTNSSQVDSTTSDDHETLELPPKTTEETSEIPEILKSSNISVTDKLSISSTETPDLTTLSETQLLDEPVTTSQSESVEEKLLNEVIAELEISTDFPQNEIAEAMINKDINAVEEIPTENELKNKMIEESCLDEKIETEFLLEIPKSTNSLVSLEKKEEVEASIDSELILPDISNPSKIEISNETATKAETEPLIDVFSKDSEKESIGVAIPKPTEIPRVSPNKEKVAIPVTVEEILKEMSETKTSMATSVEKKAENQIETADFQKEEILKQKTPIGMPPDNIEIHEEEETEVQIEFVDTKSPMINLSEKFETEVAIAFPTNQGEKSTFTCTNENSIENPIEILSSIDFHNREEGIPIPSGENRAESPIEFEVPNEFSSTKNPMLSHGQKQTLENPIEIDVPNEFCKKRASMLSPGDSECSLSLLEQIDKLLTPMHRSDSVDEFELFRAFSPSNAKRILGEAAGHIPLPLKKRRKLSEYSEENIQYKEEDDCSETIDLDGPMNLKILPKPKQTTVATVAPNIVLPNPNLVKPTTTNNTLSDLEQKEISYPSEPMLSIAHFEEDEYKEISKELQNNSNKRQYPSNPPPKYSEVMRDFQPIVAHQQTQFRPPDLQQQLAQVPQARPAPMPLQPTPQIPTVQTINIGYPMQNPYMGSNIANKPNAYPTTTIRIDSVPSGSTNNIYPGTQPVNLTNVNMDYNGHPHPIQITQTLCTPQSCMYNQRPPPTPTPEHVTKDFDIHSLLNLQNYDLNQTYLSNFLHNRQFNYQAGKSLMNDNFCNQSGCFQRNENMFKNHSMSGSHQCSGHSSRRSIIPKCGLCPACKDLVAEMIVTHNTELPHMRANSAPQQQQQQQQERQQQQELQHQQMRRYHTNSNSSPIQQHHQQQTSLPKKRGRPRKSVTPPLPTNRVTRSSNRANQKKKEEPQNDYYNTFNVSETTTKISPPAGKKRKYNTKPK